MMVPLFISMLLLFSILEVSDEKSISIPHKFKSDAIETHWPEEKRAVPVTLHEEDEPGYLRKQLLKFGEMASKIGNSVGSHASSITRAIDKVCEVVKTIIPVIAAVCHVGQFKFCMAEGDIPKDISIDLD
ncbi:uncharacterized protein LOC114338785 [Diabrotica virgifera virgifera]|uniref:Uncharacterized protein LOC114338785 n=1 Tax=Diabrotica virgifera virgifera TaxID=50390 RepID=A0A6P7GGY8_DIAVI|nr:uncharacterized protein LOC114338785 [Diabrotica virgifera virgifera]